MFDAWDTDRSGSLSLIELYRILRRGGNVSLPPALKPDPITQEEILNYSPDAQSYSPRMPHHAFGITVNPKDGHAGGQDGGKGGKPPVPTQKKPEYMLVPAPAEEQALEDPIIERADDEARKQRQRSRELLQRAILGRKRTEAAAPSPGKSPSKAHNKKEKEGERIKAFVFADRTTVGADGIVHVRLRLKLPKILGGGGRKSVVPGPKGAFTSKLGQVATAKKEQTHLGADLIELISTKCGRDGTINRTMFIDALREMGLDSEMGQSDMTSLFRTLDRNGGGQLQLEELSAAIKYMVDPNPRKFAGDRNLTAGMIKRINTLADKSVEGMSPVQQLRDSLASQAARVIDLFRRYTIY